MSVEEIFVSNDFPNVTYVLEVRKTIPWNDIFVSNRLYVTMIERKYSL